MHRAAGASLGDLALRERFSYLRLPHRSEGLSAFVEAKRRDAESFINSQDRTLSSKIYERENEGKYCFSK